MVRLLTTSSLKGAGRDLYSHAGPGSALRSRLLLLVLLPPAVLLLLGVPLLRRTSFNDPTSRFFDERRAFNFRAYSNVRQAEARAFVQTYNVTVATTAAAAATPNTIEPEPTFRRSAAAAAASPPLICVGVATVNRPSGDVYVREAVGSLLEGLSRAERDRLHVLPMVAHVNASEHPVFAEPWLRRVSDGLLTYADGARENVTEQTRARVEAIELERKRTGVPDREKTIIDYVHVMRRCRATGAPYIMMLEDDVLFLDGWFHRTRAALDEVERRAAPKEEGDPGWFYMRLFWITTSGELQHWSTRDKLTYAAAALAFTIQAVLVVGCLPRLVQLPNWTRTLRAKAARNSLPLAAAYLATLAAFTFLFFAAGRLTAVGEWEGVRSQGGCCTQGIVYPARKVDPLTAWYEEKRVGFVDSLSDELVQKRPGGFDIGSRWAIGPAVLQHVGTMSSKGDNWGSDKPGQLSASQRIWNMMFERNDPAALAAEHRRAIEAEARADAFRARWGPARL